MSYKTISKVLKNSKSASTKAAFENKLLLPSLPVPALNQTIEKYVKSVTPFLNEKELEHTKKLLREFSAANGIGPRLQKLLEEKAVTEENWLETWWLNTAYLEYRQPVVVYSSPGLVFPFEDFTNEQQRLQYTAMLILAALQYKTDIFGDQIPLEMMGASPLDMNQYKKVFGTCRIPGERRDSLQFNPDSRHIIVARNNNFFKMEVIDSNGNWPSLSQLKSALEIIIQESEAFDDPVGVLTTEHRDKWHKAYTELNKDPQNERSLKELASALFLVALDNPMPKCSGDNWRSTASKQFIHGGGSRGNSGNRWFDKTLQFIIGEDGTVGLTYEHSPSEGQPIAVMTDYLTEYINSEQAHNLPDTKTDCYPEKLKFNINETVASYIHSANIHVDKLVDNLDMASFQFKCFGKNFVKSHQLSPDSFVQMAIQLAFYRIHRVPGAQYESASTRKFIHGRTETIRSCSVESIDFAKTMLDAGKTVADKVAALKEAINKHKEYAQQAVNGMGVDRHLLGLRLLATECGIPVPAIYQDAAFIRSTHMRLSTSQVATKCDGFMCYAPLTTDGYGCCYNPRPLDMNFGVSAFAEDPDTSASVFREALEDSLRDMRDVLITAKGSKL
nr:unnamed protein product [Callosobruchus analis]